MKSLRSALDVSVYCPSCYWERGPIDLTDVRLGGGSFTGARVVCSIDRSYGSAVPSRLRALTLRTVIAVA